MTLPIFVDRFRDLGTLKLDVPVADPYKYDVLSSADPWLWDPFNFETGVIIQQDAKVISGSGSIEIPHGHMPTCPQFVVSSLISAPFTVVSEAKSYELTTGTNVIPAILVAMVPVAVNTWKVWIGTQNKA